MEIARKLDLLESLTGRTPVIPLDVTVSGAERRIHLKAEWFNPTGSIKDRTALGLLRQADAAGRLGPGTTMVESTSGNLGVALAYATGVLGLGFVAVVDPKVSLHNLRRMRKYGARVEQVTAMDSTGGYLRTRLEHLHAMLRAGGDALVWADQYTNPAGPEMHFSTTGPEIYEQLRGRVDALFCAVSTGGSLAGISRFFRKASPATRIVAVDAAGSVALGSKPAPRDLNGIGSSVPSVLLDDDLIDERVWVRDAEAFAMCHFLRDRAGLPVGGSSGAVLFAAATWLAAHPEAHDVACVLADAGTAYADTIFDTSWTTARRHDLASVRLPVGDTALTRDPIICTPQGVDAP